MPLLALAVLLGPLRAGGEPAEGPHMAMVARLIAEAKADVQAQLAAERELARKNLAMVLGRLNRTETDLMRTQGDLNQTKRDLNRTRAALRGAEGRLGAHGARLTRCEANASVWAFLTRRSHGFQTPSCESKRLCSSHNCTRCGKECA